MDPREALAALRTVERSRSEAADRLITPWWYHPALGVLVGGCIAAVLSGVHISVLMGLFALYFLGLYALVRAYRHLTGMWVSSVAYGPRARRSATRWGIAVVALALVGAVFGIGFEIGWVAPAVGLVIAVWTAVWGRRFDRVMRAELREAA